GLRCFPIPALEESAPLSDGKAARPPVYRLGKNPRKPARFNPAAMLNLGKTEGRPTRAVQRAFPTNSVRNGTGRSLVQKLSQCGVREIGAAMITGRVRSTP